MTIKALGVAILSYIIVSIPFILIATWMDKSNYNMGFEFYLAQVYILGIVPIAGGVFLVLLVFNFFLRRKIIAKTESLIDHYYRRYSFYCIAVIMIGFLTVFIADSEEDLLGFLIGNSIYVVLLVVAFFLNKQIIWKKPSVGIVQQKEENDKMKKKE